jgi:hypothetical protein
MGPSLEKPPVGTLPDKDDNETSPDLQSDAVHQKFKENVEDPVDESTQQLKKDEEDRKNGEEAKQ